MSSADEIKRLFKDAELSVDPDADEKVFDDVLQARQTVIKKVPASPEIWRILMKNPFTKFAVAAVILCVFGLLILFGNGNTLYAQVIEAIENANTIHAVTESLNDGKWEKDTEVWYEHGKGVVETGWGNGDKTFVRIDNGQYMWEYHAGNNYARRSKTINPMGVTKKLLNTDSFKEQATREPGQDKAVDGVRYMAYIQSNPESTWRNLIWLDEINRVRGWGKSRLLANGRWETYRVGEVKYNIEINPEVFTPNFGEDVKIVELDTKLDLYSDLDEALFTREELGLMFAVHELVRCEGGLIFTVTSVRPTDTWRRKVSSSDSAALNYGLFSLGSSWKRLDNYGRGRSYQPVDLGEIYHAGLQVKWTLFFPQGFEPEGPKECEFEVYLSTIGSLHEKRTKEGLPTGQRFKPMSILPLREEKTTLKQVLDNTYSSLLELEPFAACDSLTLKSIPFTDEEMEEHIKELPDSGETREYRSGDRSERARLRHGQASIPSKISKEDWTRDRLDYLKEIENNYKEFLQEVERREQRDKQ